MVAIEGGASSEGEYVLAMHCPAIGFNDGTIGCGDTIGGTTTVATNHVGNDARDHLYAFSCPGSYTGDSSCVVTFDSCASAFDTYLRIFTSDLLTELDGCDDCGPCGTRTVLTSQLHPGVAYLLVIEGYAAVEGRYSVTMSCDAAASGSGADPFDFADPCADVFAHYELNVPFLVGLGAAQDQSSQTHTVVLHGDVTIASNGVGFDGNSDYVTIENIDYASDAGFSIAFWMTKVACTAGSYEYIFSHAEDPSVDIYSRSNSNINLYLLCETSGETSSTADGSVLRYNLVDAAGQWATFDSSVHDAGDFDAITNVWMDVVLSVAPRSIRLFDDGVGLADSQYGFYSEAMGIGENLAYPSPTSLSLNRQLGRFDLRSDIFIGGRADLNSYRHFAGTIAFLRIWGSSLTEFEAHCAFTLDESTLPLSAGESSAGSCADIFTYLDLDVTFLVGLGETLFSPLFPYRLFPLLPPPPRIGVPLLLTEQPLQ